MEKFLETEKFVYGSAISADGFNGGLTSDAIDMALYQAATFALQMTCGASTGTGTLTVEACTAADGTGATAIAFEKQFVDAEGSPVDTVSDRAAVAATGFTTTAGKDGIYLIHVDPVAVQAVGKFVRVKVAETVNDPVSTAGTWIVGKARYSGQPTAVS